METFTVIVEREDTNMLVEHFEAFDEAEAKFFAEELAYEYRDQPVSVYYNV